MKITNETIRKATYGESKAIELLKARFAALIHMQEAQKNHALINDVLQREVNYLSSVAIDFLPNDKIRPFKLKLKQLSAEIINKCANEPYVTTAIKAKRSKYKEFSILCRINDLKVQEELEKFMDKFIAQHRHY